MNIASSGSGVALPLAQMVSGIIESANYDPSTDPNRQNALKTAYDLQREKDRNTVIAENMKFMNDPYAPVQDIQTNLLGVGVEPQKAADYALSALTMRGRGGQSVDDFMMEMSPLAVARGDTGGATFAGGTFNARNAPTKVVKDGQATLVAAQDSYGQTPVLSESEYKGGMLGDLAGDMSRPEKMRVVGAAPLSETILNYGLSDGTGGSAPASQVPYGPGVTVYSGQATGTADQLRPTVKAGLQTQSIANQQFGNMLDMAENIAVKDPTLFGATGNVRRFAQNIGQQVANVRQLAPGSTLGDAFADVQQRAAQNGVQLLNPMQYDPNLSDIVTMSELLVFGAAEALANQQGRSVSDKDVNMFRSIVGDPTGWTSSQEQFLSKMGLIRNVLGMKQNVINNALGGNAPPAATGPNPPQNPVQLPPEAAASLPPGAVMLPDGRARLADGTIAKWVP